MLTLTHQGWINTFEGKKGTGKEDVFESEMVKELRSLGAVLYCKTSVPQSLMTGETVNNIIGYTTNPKNRNLSCGGSSGGEGVSYDFGPLPPYRGRSIRRKTSCGNNPILTCSHDSSPTLTRDVLTSNSIRLLLHLKVRL